MAPLIWLKLLEKIKLLSENSDMDMLTTLDSKLLMDNKHHVKENVQKCTENSSNIVLFEAMPKNDVNSSEMTNNLPNHFCDDIEHFTIVSSSLDNQMSSLDHKLQDFMINAEQKLDLWIKHRMEETSSFQTSLSVENGCDSTTSTDCDSLRSQQERLLKLNSDKENEIVSLKEELSYKDSIIQDLQKEVKCLSKELNAKNQRLADMRSSTNNTGFEAKIIQLEITTKKQNLQLSALQEQNNKLSAENKLKDQMISSKQNEISVLLQKMRKHEMQRSISRKSFAGLRQRRNTNPENVEKLCEATPCCGDMVIIHDLFQKGFNVKLLKNRNISVKEIWANKLKDALSCAQNMKIKPKLVLLHTGSKDLLSVPEEEIVKTIVDIYHVLNRRNIKFIWSNLVPRYDDFEVNSKGYFVNMRVNKELTHKPGAYIEHNEHFYLRDMLHPSILDVICDEE